MPGGARGGDTTRDIKNKDIRRALVLRKKIEKKRERKLKQEKRRNELAQLKEQGVAEEDLPKKPEPRTIENQRQYDDNTLVLQDDEEYLKQEENDEFVPVFKGEVTPHVLITSGIKPSQISYSFIQDLLYVIPNSVYYKRANYDIKEVIKYSTNRNFTDVLVVKDDHSKLTTLMHIHLGTGPTALYKVLSYVPATQVGGHGNKTSHQPELILNRFTTKLGHRVGRMLGSLFPHDPKFEGRQVVTVHNQRDFIFFRFHRYIFNSQGNRARLQELGPRFTLKLKNLQRGTFQRDEEHEWIPKRGEGGGKHKFVL